MQIKSYQIGISIAKKNHTFVYIFLKFICQIWIFYTSFLSLIIWIKVKLKLISLYFVFFASCLVWHMKGSVTVHKKHQRNLLDRLTLKKLHFSCTYISNLRFGLNDDLCTAVMWIRIQSGSRSIQSWTKKKKSSLNIHIRD